MDERPVINRKVVLTVNAVRSRLKLEGNMEETWSTSPMIYSSA